MQRPNERSVAIPLAVVIGLLLGLAGTYLVLRPSEDTSSSSPFDGPASVRTIDRPAASAGADLTGAEILAAAAAGQAQPAAVPATEPASASDAVDRFLRAEIADRSDESFALLRADLQRRFGSVAAWRQSRADRVVPERFAIVGQRVISANTTDVTVRAWRTPSITPFRGLVAAETTEQWAAVDDGGTWRLMAATAGARDPHLPDVAGAVAIAQRWVDGAARCDAGIVGLQLERDLLGRASLVDDACAAKGEWRADGRAVAAAELGDVTAFVAAYGPGVGRWARGVQVTRTGDRTSPSTFTVLLGPVGEEWRVIGLTTA